MSNLSDHKLEAEKQRGRKQWGSDPAGALYGRDHEFGSKEFFDEVERHRYQRYAPWMPVASAPVVQIHFARLSFRLIR